MNDDLSNGGTAAGEGSFWGKEMRLVMIRHGRPKWQPPALVSLSRFNCLPAEYDAAHLSEEGTRAIDTLAARLPKGLILSSDLPRARETAEIIAGENGEIELDPMFRELQGSRVAAGLFGKLRAPPVVWSLIGRVCWALGIGECSEKPRVAWDRTAKATNKILKRFETEETVILVSHGWFILLLAVNLRWRGLIERGPLIPRTGFGAMTEYLLRAE